MRRNGAGYQPPPPPPPPPPPEPPPEENPDELDDDTGMAPEKALLTPDTVEDSERPNESLDQPARPVCQAGW